ncbi:MAG TPA: SpoIIE family protein phosphatase [Thermoanaerobaculia bacterium]|jgi:serine phosphatase RsbU (regulator of sigma subunit)|nr:SpoIIE family protein phosphatase [Thermoanaerobaculia bacterium]
MTNIPTPPPKRRSHAGRKTFLVWIICLAEIIFYSYAQPVTDALSLTPILTFVTFIASLVFIALTLYLITIAIRWLLRKLFWRVGRRLFLSYVLIGLLPFFLMTILLLAIGYMIAGVMSHAALRGERQATLGQMESQALEYGLTGRKPADRLKTLEIYDTAAGDADKLPAWLRKTSFSGIVSREDKPLLVASRQFAEGSEGETRSVVFVQPIDEEWARQLEEKGGMIIAHDDGTKKEKANVGTITVNGRKKRVILSGDSAFDEIMRRGFAPNRVLWADPVAPTSWETGETDHDKQFLTLLSNPISNLFQFYFGASSGSYMRILANVILALVVMLCIIYMFAAAFAAVLIFSISRAVNRIEKGTKAVERGDFSYRINMKPHNQLGEMAQSFDRMTESIASLLTTVAEKERLQSEIAIAASIQRNLLPKEGPQFRGVSFSAHFEPTTSIGGDYYDVFNLDKSRLAVAIGDVSGHGLSTGLVMAMVKAAITTLVEEGAEETSLFHRLNELVFRSTERRAFMTLAFTIFDLERGLIRHTNAGHLYPYLLRKDAQPMSIESPSFPLGVRHEITTRTVELDLQEGDTMVYLSDGIVEAQNEEGDPLGFDQLEALLAEQVDRSPSAIRDSILTTVARHSGSRPADDDRTIMILRFDNFKTPLVAEPVLEETAAV